jgi:hypothetical protein
MKKPALERAIAAALSLRFAPADADVRRTIGGIIVETCTGDKQLEIATRVISREMSEWPGPAEFRRMIGAAVKAAFQLPAGCPRCLGVDFVIVEKDGSSMGQRCSCKRGQVLALMDAKRRTGTASGKDCSTAS